MNNDEIIQKLEEIDDYVCDLYYYTNGKGRVLTEALNKIRALIEELKTKSDKE